MVPPLTGADTMNTDCKLPASISYPERQIIAAIITEALARNYAVSVFDGEEWALQASTHRPVIEASIGTTDTTTLRFRDLNKAEPTTGAPKVIGTVFLVHDNGSDVVANYTDNEAIERLLAPAHELADTYRKAGL